MDKDEREVHAICEWPYIIDNKIESQSIITAMLKLTYEINCRKTHRYTDIFYFI